MTLQAANVLADNNTNIAAGRNFTAASEENYAHTDGFKEEKTSGIFSSGGLGFTIGTQQVKSERDSSALTQAGTNIAGFAGDVKITAGDTAHLTSASILAGKNASITAKETQIDGRENIYRDVLTQESRTTGLTVSLGHGLLSLGQEIAAPLQRMGEVQDDRLKAVYAWKAGRLIHENFGKGQNPLKDSAGFSLNLSLGTSKSYSRTESVTREYAGSKIAAGEKADLTATERDLAMQGSKVEGKNVALAAKQNIALLAGENSNRTTGENEASSAGIGVSFSPQGLSSLNLSASKAQGNSKENASTYTPTEIAAKNALQIESGKDTNILGSTVQGDKVTAKIGGNLNIETLQEKETYEEKNTSAGFELSWDIRAGKFSKPTFGLSAGRGTIDSHYRSARGQSGIFAGKGGFDIYVEKNTDLKGAVIASEADAGKNRLSTGTFSFSDLENGADYSAKSIGAEYHHYGSYDKMSRQEKNKVYNTIGLSPSLSMPAKGDANSTTNAAVAPGTIDIRENPTQDISALNRDTTNTLNELGRIFDKQTIEEQQELAKAFGEEAFRLAHNLPDDGSGRKIAVHAIIGGIMSQITGAGFASGAIGAGVNEAVIGEIKKIKDPGTAQIVSAIVGAAAAKAAGEAAGAGATSAASGTKWNFFLMEYPSHYGIDALALQTLKRTDGNTLSSIEIAQYIQGMYKILSESEPALSDMQNMQAENIDNYPKAISYLVKSGITKESAIQFFKGYNELLRKQDWTVMALAPMPPINVIADKESGKLIDVQPPHMRPYKGVKEAYAPKVFTGENLKLSDNANKDDFSWLSSIATNSTTEVSNRLPTAIQMSGYWVKPLSIYLKAGGVVGLGWTIRDMKQDWNTYSGGRLGIAWTADVIPIGASALGGLAGTTIGGPGAVLSGPFGSITGAILGDWAKYKIKENIPKDTHGE